MQVVQEVRRAEHRVEKGDHDVITLELLNLIQVIGNDDGISLIIVIIPSPNIRQIARHRHCFQLSFVFELRQGVRRHRRGRGVGWGGFLVQFVRNKEELAEVAVEEVLDHKL